MESGLSKNKIISLLTRSPHGELAQYAPVGVKAASEDPEFFGRLIAWNQNKGVIRDAKVALPVLALTSAAVIADAEIRGNALAHIAKLDPRNLVRAVRFAKGQPIHHKRGLMRVVEQYLRHREATNFDRVALQHKGSLQELYALCHIKPSEHAQAVLFKGEKLGVFADVAGLKDMSPTEAAGTIISKRIPFLVAAGALGAKMKSPAVVQALIGAMSPTELVTNAKMLDKLGVKTNPALRAAFESATMKAADSGASVLKTTRAADAIGGATGDKLRGLQEKQLDKLGMKGNWLVVADKSASMQDAIEAARQVAAVLARSAEGNVHLVFFDTSPLYFNATGKTLDEITEVTKRVMAGGATSIGVGVQYAVQNAFDVDGIAVVSDGAENSSPMFAAQYTKLCEDLGKDLPVYLYWMKCHQPNECNNNPNAMATNAEAAGISLQVFDLRGGTDFYALPNIISTMRTNRFAMIDEIMATKFLRLDDVFKQAA